MRSPFVIAKVLVLFGFSGISGLKVGLGTFSLVISLNPDLAFSMFMNALVGFSLSSRLKFTFFSNLPLRSSSSIDSSSTVLSCIAMLFSTVSGSHISDCSSAFSSNFLWD